TGAALRHLEGKSLAEIRRGAKGDEGALDATSRNLRRRILEVRQRCDGAQAAAEAASADLVRRARRNRVAARGAPRRRMDGRGFVVDRGLHQTNRDAGRLLEEAKRDPATFPVS